jgi:hypothetical protein
MPLCSSQPRGAAYSEFSATRGVENMGHLTHLGQHRQVVAVAGLLRLSYLSSVTVVAVTTVNGRAGWCRAWASDGPPIQPVRSLERHRRTQ